MGVVDAAELGSLLAEGHQFVGAGVAAGGVVKAGGNAESALLHAFTEQGFLVFQFGGCAGAVVPAHGADAQGGSCR